MAIDENVRFALDFDALQQCDSKGRILAADLFAENGFLRVDNVFETSEIDDMKNAMSRIIDIFDPAQHPKSIFRANNEIKHISDQYFLESVDKIRFFYEEGALDEASGRVKADKQLALNKVGHALHWLDSVFKKYTFSNNIKTIMRVIGFNEPKIVQSMYIFKPPHIGGEVGEHVDSTFLHVEPPRNDRRSNIVGVWVALDDSTCANGCLEFIPRSHKIMPTTRSGDERFRFVRTNAATTTASETIADNNEPLIKFVGTKPSYERSEFVPVEVARGSLLLIDGDVVHRSGPNRSSHARHAYTFHVVEAASNITHWNESNWLQETDSYKFPLLFEN